MDDRDIGVRAAATFRMLSDLGEQLNGIRGPKTIVWLTAGAPNLVRYPYGCRDVVIEGDSESYLAGGCSGDCRKWGVDKCINYSPFLRHFSAELSRNGTIIQSVEVTAEGALAPAAPGSAKDTLQQLANLTGGRVYTGGEVEKAIVHSLRDAGARYRLAFEDPPADGKYHRLRVACTRKGVRLEAQRGYFAEQR